VFVVSSSVGSVKLLKIDGKEPCLAAFKEEVSWNDVHFFRYASMLVTYGRSARAYTFIPEPGGLKHLSQFEWQV
jgi:hypothetical protein